MATKRTGGAKSAPLEPKIVEKFLHLLSTDNGFRREFKKNPGDALAKIGHKGRIECASVKAIAPKKEFVAASDALKAYAMSTGLFSDPHCFEAGKVASTLRRK